MAHAYETRHRRNGAIDLRDDMAALQKDFSQLTDGIGSVVTARWSGIGKASIKAPHGWAKKCGRIRSQLWARALARAYWRVF